MYYKSNFQFFNKKLIMKDNFILKFNMKINSTYKL